MTLQHWITITPVDPPAASLQVYLGPDRPTPSGGVGGWSTVQRPKRRSLTEWQGVDPATLSVNVLLGGSPTADIQDRVRHLVTLGLPTAATGQPPILRISGPIQHGNRRWVINELAWGDFERRQSDGVLYRQLVTITFLEFVASDLVMLGHLTPAQLAAARAQALAASAAAAAAQSAATSALAPAASSDPLANIAAGLTADGMPADDPEPTLSKFGTHEPLFMQNPSQTYTVKTGDTLTSIAARFLGESRRWVDIAALNGNIRDPKAIVSGQILVMPSGTAPNNAGWESGLTTEPGVPGRY